MNMPWQHICAPRIQDMGNKYMHSCLGTFKIPIHGLYMYIYLYMYVCVHYN